MLRQLLIFSIFFPFCILCSVHYRIRNGPGSSKYAEKNTHLSRRLLQRRLYDLKCLFGTTVNLKVSPPKVTFDAKKIQLWKIGFILENFLFAQAFSSASECRPFDGTVISKRPMDSDYENVFICTIKGSDEEIILKIPELEASCIDDAAAEVKYSLALNHPYIVHFLGGTLTPKSMLYMKYYTGNIYESKIQSLQEFKRLIIDMLLALRYLHNGNLIHHDLKQENIFHRGDGHFVLADFGTASLHGNKNIYGTAGFYPPEHKNDQTSRPAYDFYCLGIVIKEEITDLYKTIEHDKMKELEDDYKELIGILLSQNYEERNFRNMRTFRKIMGLSIFGDVNWEEEAKAVSYKGFFNANITKKPIN